MPSASKDKNGNYESRESYLKKCIPIVMKESNGNQKFSIAKCEGMYREKYQESKSSSDNSDGLSSIKKSDVEYCASPTENPTQKQTTDNLNVKNMKTTKALDTGNDPVDTKEANKKSKDSIKVPNMDTSMSPDETKTTASDYDGDGINGTYNGAAQQFMLDVTKSRGYKYKKPLRLTEKNELIEMEAKQIHEKKCDECDGTISKSEDGKYNFPDSEPNRGEINMQLHDEDTGFPKFHSFCCEGCAMAHLIKRHDIKHQKLLGDLEKSKNHKEKIAKMHQPANKNVVNDKSDSSIHDENKSINSTEPAKDSFASQKKTRQ